ncbi:hypothetical protein BGX24_008261 [Mortierella sp. AD032]|nr:hypothetical protein BGX24_008261 [Mortierella sp. AD032]
MYSLHTPTNKPDSLAHYVFSSALVPSSAIATLGLSVLIVSNMSLTNDGLVTILQGSPRLTGLTFACVNLIGPILSFQHTGMKSLNADFKFIFPDAPTDASVFSYFPNVERLNVWDPPPTFSSGRIKEILTRHCPRLTGYKLQDKTGTPLVPEFCTNIAANNITEIMFRFRHISLETVSAILMHQASLKSVRHFSFPDGIDMEAEQVAPVSNHFQAWGSFLQLIPRGCSKLETLELNAHEMDMDVVEQGEWACKNLKNIQIRVKGLDTKDKILKAIALWRKGCWQRWQEEAGAPVGAERRLKETDTSIEARVARHLLKFDKLWTVWLGYQSWNPI